MSTKIEWTDETWNPVTGCTKVSAGCDHCYAERISHRFKRTFDVVLHEDRLGQPLRWRKPRRVFVCSMGDLFHAEVPDAFIEDVFGVMLRAEEHTFQILTKRPRRMRKLIGPGCLALNSKLSSCVVGDTSWPLPNVWLGTSVESEDHIRRIGELVNTPAAVRFVSFEPLLGDVNLRFGVGAIDWAIVGGESGPGARPMDPDWARSIRDQCKVAGVPFFMKQMGGNPNKRGKLHEIPNDLRIREWPQGRQ